MCASFAEELAAILEPREERTLARVIDDSTAGTLVADPRYLNRIEAVADQLHKVVLDRGREASLDTMLNFEIECLVQTAMSRDNLEGIRAFFEKREPNFTGA